MCQPTDKQRLRQICIAGTPHVSTAHNQWSAKRAHTHHHRTRELHTQHRLTCYVVRVPEAASFIVLACHSNRINDHVVAPLEWQRGAEDLGSPLVRGEWWATRVILPAVEAYIVVERRVVGCTDMLAIAVQRVARVRPGGGRERCVQMSVVVSKFQLWSVSGAPNSKARPSAHARGGLSASSLPLLIDGVNNWKTSTRTVWDTSTPRKLAKHSGTRTFALSLIWPEVFSQLRGTCAAPLPCDRRPPIDA